MNLKNFWYIACETKDLKPGKPFFAEILNEWVVVFKNASGEVTALQDRCLHRCAQLSKGEVKDGKLQCPYHGWIYDGEGQVVGVPSEGPKFKNLSSRKIKPYEVLVQEDYIYVRLERPEAFETKPFQIPEYKRQGWKSIRLKNHFENNVTNCAENFVDIPHTLSVHPGIFRKPRQQKFEASAHRKDGSVYVEYKNETSNLGYFSWFLNPENREIFHSDAFYMPNITSVRYEAGPNRIFVITSQSIPQRDDKTLVYTDLTYNYGIWNWLSGPIVRHQAQKIIDQDVVILKNQMDTIKKYGDKFQNSEADVIHIFIESIRKELEEGRDPRKLPDKRADFEFWI